MRGKYKILSIVSVLVFIISTIFTSFPNKVLAYSSDEVKGRLEMNFNNNWKFYRGDVNGAEEVEFYDDVWEDANLPHTVRVEPRAWNGTTPNYQGIAWYRRDFYVDSSLEGKKVFVEFEGAMGNTEVWVNGVKLTKHFGGYLPIILDLTEVVNFGENNVIAVKVDNSDDPETPPGKPQNGLDFMYYGGIYRNVNMLFTDKVYVTNPILANKVADGGVFIQYPEVSKEKALVSVKTNVKNDYLTRKKCSIVTEIIDKDENVVATNSVDEVTISPNEDFTFEQNIEVINPKLWSPNEPNLYNVKSKILVDGKEVDTVTTRIGVRTIEFTVDDGFYINGEKTLLYGANRHQEYLYIGNAAPDSLQYQDAKQIKDGGYNMVRTGHYPVPDEFLDACDELGIAVIEPTPGWQIFGGATFQDRVMQNIKDMVRKDRNHPSIVLWESSLNESWVTRDFAQRSYDVTHEEYPGSQCYVSAESSHFGDIYDVNYKEVDTANKPLITREWGDEWTEDAYSDEGYRSVREVGEVDMINSSIERQNGLNGGGYFDWVGLNKNPRISGYAVWSFNDYNRGYDEDTCFSGVVDRDRYPKFNYYYLQSQRDPSIIQEGVDCGPMTFIANYWTEDSSRDVNVYSNCEEIKLYLNGNLVDTRKPDEGFEYVNHPIFTFENVPWEAGNLRAEGIINGEVVSSYEVNTPKEPHHIEFEFVKSRNTDLIADSSDVIIAYAKVTDEDGTVIPGAENNISLHVTGEGKLVGNGDSRVKSNPVKATDGIAPIFIQSTQTSGDINITATAEGLESNSITIKSVPSEDIFVPGGKQKGEDIVAGKNIGFRKPVTVSSELEENRGINVNDGDKETSWKPAKISEEEWAKIDLEESRNITGIELNWESDNTGRYLIEVSDDNSNWTSLIKSDCIKQKQVYKLASNARYVRVKLLDNVNNYSNLSEFIIYGNDKNDDEGVEGDNRANIAIGKEVVASSFKEGNEPQKSNDGDNGSMWRAKTDGLEWLTIDLGALYNLTGSKILWGKDSVYYSYVIEVSEDNENWSQVVKSVASGQNMLPDDFNTKWARYVRVKIDKINGGTLEVPAIREFEIYGDEVTGVEKISQKDIKVKSNSEETVSADNKAIYTLDGNEATIWHSRWSPETKKNDYVIMDLGEVSKISKVKYLPRKNGGNGTITGYNVYVSDDGENFTKVQSNGIWANNGSEKQTNFEAVNGRYIKLECTSGVGNYVSASEINVYEIENNTEVKIPQNEIKPTASSEELSAENNSINNAFDGDEASFWHTSWATYLEFDLGNMYNVEELRYLPRQDGGANGNILAYDILASEDGVNYTKIESDKSWGNNKQEKATTFKTQKARYIKLIVRYGEKNFASAAEVNIYKSIVDSLNIETIVGVKPELPDTIDVKVDDETTKNAKVIWNEIDPSLYAKEGSFNVSGKIKDTKITVEAEVNVVKGNIYDLADLNKDGKVNIADLALASKNFNKNSSDSNWNQISSYDINKDGLINNYEIEYIANSILSK